MKKLIVLTGLFFSAVCHANGAGNSADGCVIGGVPKLYDFVEHGIQDPYLPEERDPDESLVQLLRSKIKVPNGKDIFPYKKVALKIQAIREDIPELGYAMIQEIKSAYFRFVTEAALSQVKDLGKSGIDPESCDEFVKLAKLWKRNSRVGSGFAVYFSFPLLEKMEVAHLVGLFTHEVLGIMDFRGDNYGKNYTREDTRELNADLYDFTAYQDLMSSEQYFSGFRALHHQDVEIFTNSSLYWNPPITANYLQVFFYLKRDSSPQRYGLSWLNEEGRHYFQGNQRHICLKVVKQYNEKIEKLDKVMEEFERPTRAKGFLRPKTGHREETTKFFYVLSPDHPQAKELLKQYNQLRKELTDLQNGASLSRKEYPELRDWAWLPNYCLSGGKPDFLNFLAGEDAPKVPQLKKPKKGISAPLILINLN